MNDDLNAYKCKLFMEYMTNSNLVNIRITSPTGKEIGLIVADKILADGGNNIYYKIKEKEIYLVKNTRFEVLFQKYEIIKNNHDSLEVLDTIINFPYINHIYGNYDYYNGYEKNNNTHCYNLEISMTAAQMVAFKHIADMYPHLSLIT